MKYLQSQDNQPLLVVVLLLRDPVQVVLQLVLVPKQLVDLLLQLVVLPPQNDVYVCGVVVLLLE